MNTPYDLNFWQRMWADLGQPNKDNASNYSDAELQYYLRDILKDYDEFIPTPVLRDAVRGARIREEQPMSRGSNYPLSDDFDTFLRDALNARIAQRNAPAGAISPSGGDIQQMWSAPLSPRDAILRQIKLGEQQGSGTGDYYPPIE